MKYLLFVVFFLVGGVNASLLCDWNGNVRESETFCPKGMTPSPVTIIIFIGGNDDCDGIPYGVTTPNYTCSACRAEDICSDGEVFGKDCFCESYCSGTLKEDDYGEFFCEKNSNLVCPKGYQKTYVNQGFQRHYECKKGSDVGGSSGGGSSSAGSSGSGGGAGGGGANGVSGGSGGSSGSSGGSSPKFFCKDGKCQKCATDKFFDGGEKESLDCSEANASCAAYLNVIASSCSHWKCGNACSCIQVGSSITKEFKEFFIENEQCKVLTKSSGFNSWECKKTITRLCQNSQRTVSADSSTNCESLPADSGCFDFGTSFSAPQNEPDCLASGGRWVGAGNGMCHFEGDGVPVTGGGTGENGGNSGNGASGSNGGSGGTGGNGSSLTQVQLDESLTKFGEKYGNGNTMTQKQFEETLGKANEGMDGDLRPQLKGVVTSEMSTQMREFGQKLDKLLQVDGKRIDVAFKELLGKQYEKVSSWFNIKVSDCSVLSIRLILNIDAINVHVDQNLLDDPTVCMMLRVLSLLMQVGVYLKLIFYLLKS